MGGGGGGVRVSRVCGGFRPLDAGGDAAARRSLPRRNFHLSFNGSLVGSGPFVMKADIHPKYVESEIRCACGNVIKTRSTKPVMILGICNACHPFYTGTQKFVDTAGRVDKFQQRMAKTQAAQKAAADAASTKKKKK
jgi:large subunit ribosomal protein L31